MILLEDSSCQHSKLLSQNRNKKKSCTILLFLVLSILSYSGWGKTSFGGSPSEVLLDVNLPIWEKEECERVFQIRRDPIDYEYQFCAGPQDGGEDACDVNTKYYYSYFAFSLLLLLLLCALL